MRVFSGIRPTGELHLGNYFGAVKQWLELQENKECFFCIVDLHAITTPYDHKNLQKNIFDLAVVYLAAGLNPEKGVFFVQSQVAEHSELAWILGTITPYGDLTRMTQFKEKAKKHRDYVNAGLLYYPVLMAADILLYKTELVPVGQDQKQHVEIAREIARRFNKEFGEVFVEPKCLLPKLGAKIMSLAEPKKKMSKTDDPRSCLGLFDPPEEIERKIMAAVTDLGREIKYDPVKKPGIANLLAIYSLLADVSIPKLEKMFRAKGYADFKKALVKATVQALEPFRKKHKELLAREVYVKEILSQGAKKARAIARATMAEVRQKTGLT